MRRTLCLMFLVLGGCTNGYALDYLKPRASLIAPQLVRYGLNDCVGQRLTERLTVWQLRQLADLAARLEPGGRNPASLGAHEFVYIAGLVEDPKVAPEARDAIAACAPAPVAAREPIRTPQPSTPAETPGNPLRAQARPLWVNLGSAQTGQGIAVDAASVTRGEGWRLAWFRLLNGAQAGEGDVGYLLNINCAAKTISAHAGRKYGKSGALTEEKVYEKPEGPLPIEPGTVMDVAFQSLCYEPR